MIPTILLHLYTFSFPINTPRRTRAEILKALAEKDEADFHLHLGPRQTKTHWPIFPNLHFSLFLSPPASPFSRRSRRLAR